MKEPTLFTKTVRRIARSIPKGKVITYGMLAKAAGGSSRAALSVTSILSRDPNPKEIPFHRIVYSSGKVWLNPSNPEPRINLYRKEGIEISKSGKIVNFRDALWGGEN